MGVFRGSLKPKRHAGLDGVCTVRVIVQRPKVPVTVPLFDLDPHALPVIYEVTGVIGRTDVETDLDDRPRFKRLAVTEQGNPELVWILGMRYLAVIDHPAINFQCCQLRSAHKCALTNKVSGLP